MKVIYNNGTVGEITDKQEELHVIRHTAAHIMAQAIKRLFPRSGLCLRPRKRKRFLLRRRPRRNQTHRR